MRKAAMTLKTTRPVRRAAPKIGRASASVFSRLLKKTSYAEPGLCDHWPDIAGPDIAALCRPGRLTGRSPGRTLEIHAPSGAAAAQLQMQTETLKARVNRYLGPGAVDRITIVQSAVAGQFQAEQTQPEPHISGDASPLGTALSSFRAAVSRKNGGK
jgi:hypothetical protein